MKPILFTALAFLSSIFFPWSVTAVLALVAGISEPVIPLAVGIFADTLYWSPSVSLVPVCTLVGAAASVALLFVRSRLRDSTMS